MPSWRVTDLDQFDIWKRWQKLCSLLGLPLSLSSFFSHFLSFFPREKTYSNSWPAQRARSSSGLVIWPPSGFTRTTSKSVETCSVFLFAGHQILILKFHLTSKCVSVGDRVSRTLPLSYSLRVWDALPLSSQRHKLFFSVAASWGFYLSAVYLSHVCSCPARPLSSRTQGTAYRGSSILTQDEVWVRAWGCLFQGYPEAVYDPEGPEPVYTAGLLLWLAALVPNSLILQSRCSKLPHCLVTEPLPAASFWTCPFATFRLDQALGLSLGGTE